MRKEFQSGMRTQLTAGLIGLLIVGVPVYRDFEKLNDPFLAIGLGLTFLTSLYFLFSAYPFYYRLHNLIGKNQPVDMFLVPKLHATGSNYTYHDYGADLFFKESKEGDNCDISVYPLKGGNKIINEMEPYTRVKVYGVEQKHGPVVIETDKGIMWPGGRGATIRKGRPIAF